MACIVEDFSTRDGEQPLCKTHSFFASTLTFAQERDWKCLLRRLLSCYVVKASLFAKVLHGRETFISTFLTRGEAPIYNSG